MASAATQATQPPAKSAAAWELRRGDVIENRGVAKVEKIGGKWALTIWCDGTHSAYLDDSKLDLETYSRGFVKATYKYVDKLIPDPRCVRAPCKPVAVRQIRLTKLTTVRSSLSEAEARARACGPLRVSRK